MESTPMVISLDSSINVNEATTSTKRAVEFMAQFYKTLGYGTEVTVTQCSLFRQIQLKSYIYWVAKEFITNHPSGQQAVVPIVVDGSSGWIKTMSWPAYQQFMVLGNRVNLEEPDLN